MSMYHWIIEGIGIPTSKLFDYLDRQKCLDLLRNKLGIEMTDEQVQRFDIDYDFEDLLWEADIVNVAEAFGMGDDSGLLCFGENGDGESYIYYAPSYPWERHYNEPQSISEVHDIIKKAVISLCNIDDDEIEFLIDDTLYEHGCG